MTYTLAIDWLSIFCIYTGDDSGFEPIERTDDGLFDAYPWKFKLAEYGTRQFAHLYFVAVPNAEGGWDDFAEIQCTPHSSILDKRSIIVRFTNRALYTREFWELADRLMTEQHFEFKGISRIDICADFNDFASISPVGLIEGFAAKKFRHIGRGVGALYFNHGVALDKITGLREYGVKYNGLSFGTHTSDSRVYLYNKSFELLTQGDKPWIRDTWIDAGLDVRNVWRLEVSIKNKGTKFKCKQSGKMVTIDAETSKDKEELCTIYHTFVAKLFSFVKNRRGITNISREPRLQLFDGHFHYQRGVIRNLSPGNRMEKILLKHLYQMGDLYRGGEIKDGQLRAQEFAYELANATDLCSWMSERIEEWEKPNHK